LNVWFHITPFNEKFEDIIGVIRIRISKRNWTTQWPKEKGEKEKQVDSGAPEWQAVPAPLVA
jgi:hypothetical protein